MARNYMMRSEKRESTLQSHKTPAKKRSPKRRKKGAGFLYCFCMYFLLLLLWPFGLLMLWRKKVRWNAGMKLLVSIVTLAAFVLIYGFALTVDTGNEAYTEIQDTVNSALDASADWLIQAGKTASEKSVVVLDGAKNLTGALLEKGRDTLPDALDKGVEIAGVAKEKFVELANKVGWKLELPEEAAVEETVEPTALPEATLAPVGRPSAQKRIEVSVSKTDDRLPIYIPDQVPDADEGEPLASGKLKRGLTTPTPSPKPTAVPTPVPSAEPEADADATEEPASEN